jgi:hypothetical protein
LKEHRDKPHPKEHNSQAPEKRQWFPRAKLTWIGVSLDLFYAKETFTNDQLNYLKDEPDGREKHEGRHNAANSEPKALSSRSDEDYARKWSYGGTGETVLVAVALTRL